MDLASLLYPPYERRLLRQLDTASLPNHVAVILDGNRRFARARGLSDPTEGHRAGAAKIDEFVGWCGELGIPYVTLWMLSTDNLGRPPEELSGLLEVITDTVDRLATGPVATRWGVRVQIVGALDLLPTEFRERLKEASEATQERTGLTLAVAVGYGGRHEIADALRSLLLDQAAQGRTIEEVAADIDVEHIAEHLYTTGLPDPDLIIRTSGEVRLSGFMLWQSAHSEFYFCDPYWPEFRRIDFLRALRDYQRRARRFGK